jgi:PASTA domain-containing protein
MADRHGLSERMHLALDEVRAPDAWTEAVRRSGDATLRVHDRGRQPKRRVAAGVVAIAVFLAAAAFARQAFSRPTTVGSSGPTPPPGMAVYTDPLGWTAVYPAAWSAVTIERTSDGLGAGVSISNESPGEKTPVNSLVLLEVTHPIDAVPDPSAASSVFPLTSTQFKVNPGPGDTLGLTFTIEGVHYQAILHAGSAASRADVTAMEDVIASIRPPSSDRTPPPSPSNLATTLVPDVVAFDVGDAKSKLKDAGLAVEISKESSADPYGTVSRQSPSAGTIVAPGDTVHLVVSVGLPGNDLGALGCPSGEQSASLIYPPFKLVPATPSDTVEALVRDNFLGIRPTDQVTTSTSEAGDNVVISRSGAVVARAFLMPHLNEWLVSEVAVCASSGVEAPSR